MSLKERVKIPNYTLGEELLNAISHGIRFFLKHSGACIMCCF